jgi:2-polyprenyl-6-methoxyphenol hydroxylase-like FAD-dependent oxidoreductase
MNQQVDVVVVGAGPVGLLAAIELTLGGVGVLVLERLAAASLDMKAGGLGPLGLEALERRGMAAAIAAAEARSFASMAQAGADPRAKGSKYSGHFAGLSLIRKDAQMEPERRSRPVDQQALEAMLADRAYALGIEVRRECDVTSFHQQADGVDVEWRSPTGTGHIRSTYLVGCDGGHSFIRKMAGFEFPGTEPSSTFYQAIAQIDHPERLAPMGWRRTSGGVFSYGPFPGRLVMLEFSGPPEDRHAPVTGDEIEDVLRRVSGADVRVKAFESGSRWTDSTRLVDSYRKRRVLLAGDAAHIHTPLGGQGLTLGLVDAANLGWKLAAVIRSEMPDSLLDTYTAERRPVAEAVLANTLAQLAIMRPDPQSGAMRDLVAKLLDFDAVNDFIGAMTSGLSTRYDLGSERDEVGRLIGNREINHGAPGLSLFDVMQRGMGILLDASTDGRASKLVQASTQRVRCVGVDRGPSMLIRPDACVAWAGKENSTDGLEQALHRWLIPALDDGL